MSSPINGLFIIDGAHGLLDGNHYQSFDMVFNFICWYQEGPLHILKC